MSSASYSASVQPPGTSPGSSQFSQNAYVFKVACSNRVNEMIGILRQSPGVWRVLDAGGCTPLHVAAEAGQLAMVQLLAKAGADVRARDNDGWEAVTYACANGHLGAVEWLLQSGANMATASNDGWQPIHAAARAGNTQICRLLLAKGADVRATTHEGHAPIHVATDRGKLEVVQLITRVTRGEALTARDNEGWQPAHNAAINGHLHVLKWIDAQRNRYNNYELHCVSRAGWQPIHAAASGGSLEVMRWLAKRRASLAALTADGWQPLHAAAHAGSLPVIAWLVQHGADLQAKDVNNVEALHLAAYAGHAAVVKWMMTAWCMANVIQPPQNGEIPTEMRPLLSQELADRIQMLLRMAERSGIVAAPPAVADSDRIARDSARAYFTIRAISARRFSSESRLPSPQDSKMDSPLASPRLMGESSFNGPGPPVNPMENASQQASRAAKQATLRAAADTAKLQSSRSFANATLAAQSRRSMSISRERAAELERKFKAEQRKLAAIQRATRARQATRKRLHAAVAIQQAWRRWRRTRAPKPKAPGVAAAAELSSALRVQAARSIYASLAQQQHIDQLRSQLRAIMEKGKIIPLGKGEVVSWAVRFFFVNDDGLCYQRVSPKLRPRGKTKLIPWADITKVETLMNDSVYVETRSLKQHYLKPKYSSRASAAAWEWALRLCTLGRLLGLDLVGHVADHAAAMVPSLSLDLPADSPLSRIDLNARETPRAQTPRAQTPRAQTPRAQTPRAQTRTYDELLDSSLRSSVAPGGAHGSTEESVDEEAMRRKRWIEYYVATGRFNEALAIGCDTVDPPPGDAAALAMSPATARSLERRSLSTPPAECADADARSSRARLLKSQERSSGAHKGMRPEQEPLLSADDRDDQEELPQSDDERPASQAERQSLLVGEQASAPASGRSASKSPAPVVPERRLTIGREIRRI